MRTFYYLSLTLDKCEPGKAHRVIAHYARRIKSKRHAAAFRSLARALGAQRGAVKVTR